MILNLDFSKLVNIGNFLFKKDNFLYQHKFYIVKDSQIREKYYLISYIKNVNEVGKVEDFNIGIDFILLEDIYILDLSLKKDIPTQIACFLKNRNYIENINETIEILKEIDISYFEIRYNFYERYRINDLDFIGLNEEIYCNYSKIRVINEDGTLGAVVQDIGLNDIKNLLNID